MYRVTGDIESMSHDECEMLIEKLQKHNESLYSLSKDDLDSAEKEKKEDASEASLNNDKKEETPTEKTHLL